MGLTIHYTLRCPHLDAPAAKRFVHALHRRTQAACRRGAAEKALPISHDAVDLTRWAQAWTLQRDPDQSSTTTIITVEPLAGWIFPVVLGAECEPLWLGLCRYPTHVSHQGRKIATRLGTGWRMSGACKTQYASLRGWAHFRQCHTGAIELLRDAANLGAKVRISDEGGWWPRRSERLLREKVAQYNGLVAALAGAVKDASDGHLAAPILAHPQFERLEAEGLAQNETAIADAARLLESLRPPPPETRDS